MLPHSLGVPCCRRNPPHPDDPSSRSCPKWRCCAATPLSSARKKSASRLGERRGEGGGAQGGTPPSRDRSPSPLCIPRDRSGTRLSTALGTAGRASATSSSVSDHLPAGSPRPPPSLPVHVFSLPAHVFPPPPLPARSARCPWGLSAGLLPPTPHPLQGQQWDNGEKGHCAIVTALVALCHRCAHRVCMGLVGL